MKTHFVNHLILTMDFLNDHTESGRYIKNRYYWYTDYWYR